MPSPFYRSTRETPPFTNPICLDSNLPVRICTVSCLGAVEGVDTIATLTTRDCNSWWSQRDMRPRYFSSASALFCVGVSAMVKPDSREVQPGLVGRRSPPDRLAVETFHVRAGPTTTSAGRQPTKSTPYAVPLTTTFFPPDSCNVGQLTQLAPPGYFIWLNEPVPVPGTTITDCYPSEFMEYYSTYRSDATMLQSRVPMMSPLVCPFGWQVVSEQDDYQACCPR